MKLLQMDVFDMFATSTSNTNATSSVYQSLIGNHDCKGSFPYSSLQASVRRAQIVTRVNNNADDTVTVIQKSCKVIKFACNCNIPTEVSGTTSRHPRRKLNTFRSSVMRAWPRSMLCFTLSDSSETRTFEKTRTAREE